MWTLEATGYALFGGILLASVGGVFIARVFKLDFWLLADAAAPGLGLGIALMRIGCFFNGCCFGWPTKTPWSVVFPVGSYAHFWQIAYVYVGLLETPYLVHPTQLYEMLGALLCVSLWFVLIRFRLPTGLPFLFFIAFFAIFRAVNWQFRVPPDTLKYPGIYVPLYILTFILCLTLIAIRFLKKPVSEAVRLTSDTE